MKYQLRHIVALASLVMAMPGLHAGEASAPKAKPKQEKIITVTTTSDVDMPNVERRIKIERLGPAEMETVAFMGVETGPVDSTLNAQLGIAPGTGLVVRSVVPDSGAAAVLHQHDVLLKLNDQILIDVRQLSVLIRNMKAGDEVAVTYIRGGKQLTAKITLGEHKVAKKGMYHFIPRAEVGTNVEWQSKPSSGMIASGDANHLLWMMDLGKDGAPHVVTNKKISGDSTVEVTVNTNIGTMNYNDEQGSLKVVSKDGKKELTAKDADGKVIFVGPVTTPEERAKLPKAVQARFDKIQGMRTFQFHTDDDFEGTEERALAPNGHDVSFERKGSRDGLRRLDTL